MCLAYEENGMEKMYHCVKEIKEGCVTIIWAIFQPFYKTFLCEFWVQNCSSIFTLSVCLSVTHPDVHLF